MTITQDRVKHSLTVSKLMSEQITDKLVSSKMAYLGLVHDIGYCASDKNYMHAALGGKMLADENYEYWEEVYWHGKPQTEYNSYALQLLNWADCHSDSEGRRVSVKERLEDVAARYGKDSEEYNQMQRLIDMFDITDDIPLRTIRMLENLKKMKY